MTISISLISLRASMIVCKFSIILQLLGHVQMPSKERLTT